MLKCVVLWHQMIPQIEACESSWSWVCVCVCVCVCLWLGFMYVCVSDEGVCVFVMRVCVCVCDEGMCVCLWWGCACVNARWCQKCFNGAWKRKVIYFQTGWHMAWHWVRVNEETTLLILCTTFNNLSYLLPL